MCFKVYFSAALFLACCLSFSDGFFLPVFVRKQAPQTPAVNNAQWAPPAPPGSSAGGAQVSYNSLKDFNPYQQGHMTPLQPVQMAPMQSQYSYDTAASMAMGPPFPQMQSSFHSLQLVPCLCPISKEVIEQQTQQLQHSPSPASQQQHAVESGSNAVMVQGSHKISS